MFDTRRYISKEALEPNNGLGFSEDDLPDPTGEFTI